MENEEKKEEEKGCPMCEISDETLKILEEKGKEAKENNEK